LKDKGERPRPCNRSKSEGPFEQALFNPLYLF